LSDQQHKSNTVSVADEKLVGIETKIAFQERAIQELNQQVYQQQKEIEKLNRLLSNLSEKLRLAVSGVNVDDSDDDVPPHY